MPKNSRLASILVASVFAAGLSLPHAVSAQTTAQPAAARKPTVAAPERPIRRDIPL